MWVNGRDKIDNKIINLLIDNARISYSEIGKTVGLSRTAVKNRITDLEQEGIISGYKPIINPHSFLGMMTFIIHLETTPECFEQTKKQLTDAEDTITVIQTTGKCHLTVICVANSTESLKSLITNLLKGINGIVSINAQAVMATLKGSIIP
jgi:DNA-binding Lrp family transcriptional regulator